MFMLPTTDEIYEWLGTLGCSLWGDWYIESPDRRRLAAEWLHKQMSDVRNYVTVTRPSLTFSEYLGYPINHSRVDL